MNSPDYCLLIRRPARVRESRSRFQGNPCFGPCQRPPQVRRGAYLVCPRSCVAPRSQGPPNVAEVPLPRPHRSLRPGCPGNMSGETVVISQARRFKTSATEDVDSLFRPKERHIDKMPREEPHTLDPFKRCELPPPTPRTLRVHTRHRQCPSPLPQPQSTEPTCAGPGMDRRRSQPESS